jgi:hypothetical protein
LGFKVVYFSGFFVYGWVQHLTDWFDRFGIEPASTPPVRYQTEHRSNLKFGSIRPGIQPVGLAVGKQPVPVLKTMVDPPLVKKMI